MVKTETLNDNFATASASKWGGYGGGTTVSSGCLSIAPTSSYLGIYSAVQYDLTSSYVMVQLVQPPNIGNGSTSAAMNIQVSAGNLEEISWENGQLVFREKVSNTNSDVSVAYDPVAHAWLRIRESAGTIYWDTSPDSLTWTNRRSKACGIGAVTSVTINLYSGYWGTEPSPGTALYDNFNLQSAGSAYTGWTVGSLSMGGAISGGTVSARNYFDTADWLWNPIPNNPVLDADSANIVAMLSQNGQQHGFGSHDYGVVICDPQSITGSTPRYDIAFTNVPAWGPDPFGTDTVPIPDNTSIPPGTDGQIALMDPTTNKVYSIWQTTHNTSNNTWGGSWGGLATLHGDGREQSGTSSTATMLSRPAGVIRISEIAAGEIPHALFFASDACATGASNYRYPAQKTDGDNSAGVAHPIQQGTRVQLDPSIDLTAIPGITAAEIAVGRALQKYGAYCGDKGGSRMSFSAEYVETLAPGQPYYDAGIHWDYFDMNHIPWSSLRVLNSWDGS